MNLGYVAAFGNYLMSNNLQNYGIQNFSLVFGLEGMENEYV